MITTTAPTARARIAADQASTAFTGTWIRSSCITTALSILAIVAAIVAVVAV